MVLVLCLGRTALTTFFPTICGLDFQKSVLTSCFGHAEVMCQAGLPTINNYVIEQNI